ncbi:MAG: hypothetical protein HZB42_14370 [Sphingobacteriales bacterium]|nr:hypothetical protein [Sphingobacteriales bacterium]
MRKKILFLAVFSYLCLISSAQNFVTLYEDCNYTGKKHYLEAGTYRLYQMKIDNDLLSCMQIPSGMRVTIYENDNFEGRSKTFTSSMACLDGEWNDMASSIVVENTNYQPGYNQNEYVVFYNDCYGNGYSQTLRPGTYSGASLGILKNNISSFTIYGNLRVRAYTTSDNASGYYSTFDASENCLSSSYNDKIRSVIVEYKPAGNYGGNYGNQFASFYTDCSYGGNSIRLHPGYYQGDKLGLFRYDISSVEIPSGLRVKVYMNESLSGSYYTLTENNSCLSSSMNNRIGSFIVEETGYGNNNNYPPNSNNAVIIYEDANYQGRSASLLPGTYSTMAQAGFFDNALSSLTVPPGYRVVLYDYENFGGKFYTITQSKPGFIISGWNDRTSSIIVYRDR